MNVVICGSMTFIDEMETIAATLREAGHSVATPAREEGRIDWDSLDLPSAVAAKARYLHDYLEVIRGADLILIANYDKAGVAGYVGANTLIEAAFAVALGKALVFLNPPGPQPCQLEALAMMTRCLDGDIARLAPAA